MKTFHFPLAVLSYLVLTSCGGGLPSTVSQFPGDLKSAGLEAAGIYPDGWAAETVSINLNQPGGKQVLAVRGTVPKIANADFQTAIEVRVDNRDAGRQTAGIGDFQILVPVQEGAGKRSVKVAFSAVQELPNGDGRMVGARLSSIGFESPKANAPNSADIVRGFGIKLGSGWGVVETFHGETFRWVNNDAQITVPAGKTTDVPVSLTVEPGPGVGGSFLLKALDASGRQVGAVRVAKRDRVTLFLPMEAGKPGEFRLHVDGGGKAAPNDPRILNFRVFQIEAEGEQPAGR